MASKVTSEAPALRDEVRVAALEAVGRSLQEGRVPAATVSGEQLLDAFDYRDPLPAPGEDFALRLEGAASPWAAVERTYLLRVAVRARGEVDDAGAPVAREAHARLALDARYVERWRLVGHEVSPAAELPFRADRLGGAAVWPGQAVTAVYEVTLRSQVTPASPVAVLRLRWHPSAGGRAHERERVLRAADLAPTWERGSRELRLAAVVARFGELLQRPAGEAGSELAELALHSGRLVREWPEQRRVGELSRLVARARDLHQGVG